MSDWLRNWLRNPAFIIGIWTLVVLCVGFFFLGGVGDFSDPSRKRSAFRILALAGSAALSCGFFVGFLFGIPQVVQGSGSVDPSTSYEQRVNTNLVQISDWLTKIIVGVGLVEMRNAPDFIWRLGTGISQSFSDNGEPKPAVVPAACAAIVFFTVIGILFGYLLTRLYFASAFAKADQHSSGFSEGQTGTVNSDSVPLNPIGPQGVQEDMGYVEKKILGTLRKYQKEHCGEDTKKRWTFAIPPGAPGFPDYLIAVGLLQKRDLIAVSPANNQVMLTDRGLEYVNQNSEDLKQIAPYQFAP